MGAPVSREEMVERIREGFRESARQTGCRRPRPALVEALGHVPREAFVLSCDRDHAYENRPLPIGHGQTISQPFVVALMAELVDPEPGDRVLEIGTGCGYAAAVMAEMVERVFTIETVPGLAEDAAARLRELGYHNVEVRCADGYAGWPEEAPFDAIVVTAAAPEVPAALVEQLTASGTLVIPVGRPYRTQMLVRVRKDEAGALHEEELLAVAFVPMVPRD